VSPVIGLQRETLESDRRFYATMCQRVNDANLAATIQEPNIKLVGPAQPATDPYKPNLSLNATIGMFGGLIAAIGWVMFREQSQCLLRTPGEVGMYLTLPELGVIPQTPNQNSLRYCGPLFRRGKPSLLLPGKEQHFAELSESFRSTLASILSVGPNGDHPRSLVVTSPQPMEGKTTVVSNLGIGLTEIGSRVLLIDGDMRRPSLHKVFDLANTWGLSDILQEKNDVEDLPLDVLVKKTGTPGLYVLPSGVSVDNIFGLLWSARMARLLPRFRKEFDYVLVDAPPCLEYSDARIIARHTDELLFVVRADYTDRRTAQTAVQRLLQDGISVMGVILNRCDLSQPDVYRYAFHSSSIQKV
jgi:polysaccharide biosynthesis transport protein